MSDAILILIGVWAFGFISGYLWRWTSIEDIVRRQERREMRQRIKLNALDLWERFREGSP